MYIGLYKEDAMVLFNPLKMGGMKIHEFIEAKEYYEACCTAEWVLENCEPKLTEQEALKIGYLVRDYMRKADVCDGDSEVYYIDRILQAEHLWRDK